VLDAAQRVATASRVDAHHPEQPDAHRQTAPLDLQ
jgi:hypothetical protein